MYSYGYGILFDFGCSTGYSANPTAALLGLLEIIVYIVIISLIAFCVIKRLDMEAW